MARTNASVKNMTAEEATAHRKQLAKAQMRRYYLKKNGLTEPLTAPIIDVNDLTAKLDLLLEIQNKPNVKKVVFKNGIREVVSDFNPTQEEPSDEEPSDQEPSDEEPSDEEEFSDDEESNDQEPSDEEPSKPVSKKLFKKLSNALARAKAKAKSKPAPVPQPILQPQQRVEPKLPPICFV